VTNWTTERGDGAALRRRHARAFTGTTLLMSTAELLAVLEEGPAATSIAAAPETVTVADPAPPPASAPRQVHRVPYAATGPAPPPRPGLLRRLRCGRRGHDPRPHRPTPNDEVVYRCLRCGVQLPPPARHDSADP
jgi:hypothetical protein